MNGGISIHSINPNYLFSNKRINIIKTSMEPLLRSKDYYSYTYILFFFNSNVFWIELSVCSSFVACFSKPGRISFPFYTQTTTVPRIEWTGSKRVRFDNSISSVTVGCLCKIATNSYFLLHWNRERKMQCGLTVHHI